MPQVTPRLRHGFASFPAIAFARALAAAAPLALAFALGSAALAQQDNPAAPNAVPAPAGQTQASSATQISSPPVQPQPAAELDHPSSASARPTAAPEPGITEEEIKQMLVGKELYLRGGYLDDSLTFNEHGKLIGHSAQGSYTLCGIEIDKVRLTKHKLELEGARYGLHFLGALPYEDPTKAVDRVRITPKKKLLKITVDRELVVKAKVKKEKGKKLEAASAPAPAAPASAAASAPAMATATPPTATGASTPDHTSPAASTPPSAPPSAQENASTALANAPAPQESASAPASAPAATEPEEPDTDEAQKEIAAAKPEERPADPNSVTATTSPAHAAKVLKDALNAVFSVGLDEGMMAAMPDFWKLYYQAAAAHTDFHPTDPGVLRQNTVDAKARLLTTFEPASNEFAQSAGVAGMALYHAVIGPDGKPAEIAVARPIGFGLDESAVDAIRKAQFEPAQKNGKPVPVLLDLVVQFRIYSKRTNVTDAPESEQAQKPAAPTLPGPYSIEHTAQQAQQ